MTTSTVRRALAVLGVALLALAGACGDDDDGDRGGPAASDPTTDTTSGEPIVRDELGQATPANAPGQVLYLQRVTIEPGAALDTHFHEGTQVAEVVEGTLTYDIVEGSATVTRQDGTVEEVTAPDTITLAPGDGLVESEDLVHFGSNDGDEPIVILLAALLADGAPLATPVEG